MTTTDGIEVKTGSDALANPELDAAIGAALPVGFRLLNEGRRLTIIRRVRPKTTWFLTVFALFWNAIVGVFVVQSIVTGDWRTLAFVSIHLLVGLGVIYAAARAWFNTTYVRVDDAGLVVEQKPFPFPKKAPIAVSEIEQLSVQFDDSYKVNGSPVEQWKVIARVRGDKVVALVDCLPQRDQAERIEHEIERFLGIRDDRP